MLTLGDLVHGTSPVLRPLNSVPLPAVPVQEVLRCAAPWELPPSVHGALVVAPLDPRWVREGGAPLGGEPAEPACVAAELRRRAEEWLTALAGGGAVGVAVLCDGDPAWRTLLGDRDVLPLLEPHGAYGGVRHDPAGDAHDSHPADGASGIPDGADAGNPADVANAVQVANAVSVVNAVSSANAETAANGAALEALLLRRQREAERQVHRQTGELLDLSCRLHRCGEGPGPLLRWLEQQTGATVTVLDDVEEAWLELPVQTGPADRSGESGESDGSDRPGEVRDLVSVGGGRHAQGARGGADSAGHEPDEQYVVFHELDDDTRRPVLAAACSTPLPQAQQELLAKAADQITLLRRIPRRRSHARHRAPDPPAPRLARPSQLLPGQAASSG